MEMNVEKRKQIGGFVERMATVYWALAHFAEKVPDVMRSMILEDPVSGYPTVVLGPKEVVRQIQKALDVEVEPLRKISVQAAPMAEKVRITAKGETKLAQIIYYILPGSGRVFIDQLLNFKNFIEIKDRYGFATASAYVDAYPNMLAQPDLDGAKGVYIHLNGELKPGSDSTKKLMVGMTMHAGEFEQLLDVMRACGVRLAAAAMMERAKKNATKCLRSKCHKDLIRTVAVI